MQKETLGGLGSQDQRIFQKKKDLRWLTRWVHRLIPRGGPYTILSNNAVTLRLGIRNNGGRRRRLDRTTRPRAGAGLSRVDTSDAGVLSDDGLPFGAARSEGHLDWDRRRSQLKFRLGLCGKCSV